MPGLLLSITAAFPRTLIGHIAARLGESELGMKQALQVALPMVLGGMIRKAESGGAQMIQEWNQQTYQLTRTRLGSVTGILGILGSGYEAGSPLAQGDRLLTVLFNQSKNLIAEAMSQYGRVKLASANTLLTLVGAVVPGIVGQYSEEHRWSPAAHAAHLIGLKKRGRKMLPRALRGLPNALVSKPRTQSSSASKVMELMKTLAYGGEGAKTPWYLMAVAILSFGSLGYGLYTIGLCTSQRNQLGAKAAADVAPAPEAAMAPSAEAVEGSACWMVF